MANTMKKNRPYNIDTYNNLHGKSYTSANTSKNKYPSPHSIPLEVLNYFHTEAIFPGNLFNGHIITT